MQNQPVPTFVAEEHHEVYCVWHYALSERLMAIGDLCLLHVDAHPDLQGAHLSSCLPILPTRIDLAHRFAITNLNIDSFISPALVQNLFSSLVWLHAQPPFPSSIDTDRKRIVRVVRRHAFNSISSEVLTEPVIEGTCGIGDILVDVPLKRACLGASLILDSPFVLDIDLDCFSCHLNPVPMPLEVEITEAEFKRLANDAQHPLWLVNGAAMTVFERDCKFVLRICGRDPTHSPGVAEMLIVDDRIAQLCATLRACKQTPRIITIARSRYSGFTPANQWQDIENKLIGKLSSLYQLDIISLRQLLAGTVSKY